MAGELSERTRAEMEAGAARVAEHGGAPLPKGALDSMMATQQRYKQLVHWEFERKIRINWGHRRHTSDPDRLQMQRRIVVYVGDNEFVDPIGEASGSWPSEVLMAQIALALMAGEHGKGKKTGYESDPGYESDR